MDIKRLDEYAETFRRNKIRTEGENSAFTKQIIGSNVTLYAGTHFDSYAIAIATTDNEIQIELVSTIFIKSTKSVQGNKTMFLLELKDEKLLSIFITLAVDLESIVKNETSATIQTVYNRYILWLDMFKPLREDVPENVIKGLINELNLLDSYLFELYGPNQAIDAWIGPKMASKDFTFESGIWYEAKAISFGSDTVKISSIEQLDSETEGYLVVSSYEGTSKVNNKAINLKSIFSSVIEKLEDEQKKIQFYTSLSKLDLDVCQILDDLSYVNNFRYIHHSTKFYLVNDSFPRLVKNNIPEKVVKVEYALSLNSLTESTI
ncbi:PD-(D/E)XK motif protein [Erysipelothrix sp. HDW6C]|uniref:PD-(D/E)XK motif protein n=1 Tax=Erysipelothrix sp. HDW6C TaxID=2714930 RepID=UPI001407DDDC|nr:PD-(D/E)XK motif protein [Erysipelothrix sp. HDW6C]QIK70269.1 PD-(D/E)XK motif protein [Erysipelothrix sp. HDW6C]